ncbi:MAG: cysteine synthase A [Candidatus Latescibacterota bacterium]|nr:cysteine synthase A [Candidatus Latescibacterota bacterium]
MRTANTILDTIGQTPLLRLNRVVPPGSCAVWGKLESRNPGGSVKDRIGINMIRAAESSGKLCPGMTIVEPTSGNTGIALAMVSAALGYRLILTMPDNMSSERRQVMLSYGAELETTPAKEDMAGAIERAKEIVNSEPTKFFMPQQFDNESNPMAHIETTAKEILEVTGRDIDAFVVGVGTGGTITGVGEVLKKEIPQLHIVAVEPSRSAVLSGSSPGLHGIQGIGAGFVPTVLDRKMIDEIIAIDDSEAFYFARRLAREEGLLLGPSSGANVAASLRVAENLNFDQRIVTFFCDTGFRYFSVEGFISDSTN